MIVKIKTWDDMVKEFGLNKDGNINCSGVFVTDMEEEMPKNRIIDTTDGDWISWIISHDMIEEYIKK